MTKLLYPLPGELKIVDAPASVSVISARKIANSSELLTPLRHLMNVPGVTVANYTANSMNIEMRSGNVTFGTAVLPLLDYRVISIPLLDQILVTSTGYLI